MTLAQLGYAVAVDARRHFGAAAAASGVTQPTPSAGLRKPEEAVDVALLAVVAPLLAG